MAQMEYRKLRRGGEAISVIGLGMGYIHEDGQAEAEATVRMALDRGVNYFDMAAGDGAAYPAYGRALAGRREQVYLQMHFGAVYGRDGAYGWSRDLREIKASFSARLKELGTDYTDMGFVHCTDDAEDFQDVMTGGLWDYMKGLKADGIIRHLGLSSHNPEMIQRFLETDLIDMVMFSINPAYDYATGDYGIGTTSERGRLYRACEAAGVGISVMKPFGGGQLLDAGTSPFRKALTQIQCIQYALDRPAVLTVLPGVRNRGDLERVLAYLDADAAARDYSVIGAFAPPDAAGKCVYCNHCQPCPAGINVGLVNKYYDLALAGDKMAKGHYEKLSIHADACLQCGHCERRCPFHVQQEARMAEINAYFSEGK